MAGPKKGIAYEFTAHLLDASTGNFVVDPTLAAGDVKVNTAGGGYANITTLPAVDPSGSIDVKVSLSTSEMDDYRVSVLFSDVAGTEWKDAVYVIEPMDVLIEDLNTQIDDLPAAILDTAVSEPGAVFTWPASLRNIIAWLGALSRNKRFQDLTTQTLRNDADSGTIATSPASDAGGVTTRGEWS